jgi:hypothetical protein
MTHHISLKLTARSLTAAVLSERELIYVEIRKLAPNLTQAQDSITSFIGLLAAHFSFDSASLMECKGDTRAKSLCVNLVEAFRTLQLPHWEVSEAKVFSAYAEKPLARTSELRKVVSNYWPHVIDDKSDKTCLDAAALGLYIQTERLLAEICEGNI